MDNLDCLTFRLFRKLTLISLLLVKVLARSILFLVLATFSVFIFTGFFAIFFSFLGANLALADRKSFLATKNQFAPVINNQSILLEQPSFQSQMGENDSTLKPKLIIPPAPLVSYTYTGRYQESKFKRKCIRPCQSCVCVLVAGIAEISLLERSSCSAKSRPLF